MKKAAGNKKTNTEEKTQATEFDGMRHFSWGLIDIGWRLLVVVLLFTLGGRELDNYFGTDPLFGILGFLLIIAFFVLIVLRTLQKIPKEYGGLKK